MKLLIICSEKSDNLTQNEFYVKTDSRFANTKFIPHLQNIKEICTVCGKECTWCRGKYKLNFKESISQVVKLPDFYQLFEDEPLKYLPTKFEEHDLAVVIGIHQDILIELPKLIKESGGSAILAPSEGKEWFSKSTREMVIEECKKYGLQYAFPKPFCTLKEGEFPVINQFIHEFKLGKPKFKLYINNDNIIVDVKVVISAPCGNGYNIAKHLIGNKLGEEAKKSVAKFWHSYPCLGGMHIDNELGDTPLHIGGYTHYNALEYAEIIRIK